MGITVLFFRFVETLYTKGTCVEIRFIKVKRLVRMLCGLYDLPLPADLVDFGDGASTSTQQIGDSITNKQVAENDVTENLEEGDSEEENLGEDVSDEEMELSENTVVRQIYFNCRKLLNNVHLPVGNP